MNHCAMETVKKMLKGIWEFCRYVFVPQRRYKDLGTTSRDFT